VPRLAEEVVLVWLLLLLPPCPDWRRGRRGREGVAAAAVPRPEKRGEKRDKKSCCWYRCAWSLEEGEKRERRCSTAAAAAAMPVLEKGGGEAVLQRGREFDVGSTSVDLKHQS
jgi:hypothetical protein